MGRARLYREVIQARPPSKAFRQAAFALNASSRGLSKGQIVEEARLFPKGGVSSAKCFAWSNNRHQSARCHLRARLSADIRRTNVKQTEEWAKALVALTLRG